MFKYKKKRQPFTWVPTPKELVDNDCPKVNWEEFGVKHQQKYADKVDGKINYRSLHLHKLWEGSRSIIKSAFTSAEEKRWAWKVRNQILQQVQDEFPDCIIYTD